MSDLSWYELHAPGAIGLPGVTAMLRPLAGRAHQGIWRKAPVVAFELWITHDSARWLIGLDNSLTSTLPEQLRAQMPGLTLTWQPRPARTPLLLGMTVRSSASTHSLRTDTAGSVTAALMRLAGSLSKQETLAIQWIVGSSVHRSKLPSQFCLSEALGLKPASKPVTRVRQAWRAKANEPVFLVQGRIAAKARYQPRSKELLRSAFNALELTNGPYARLAGGRYDVRTARRLTNVAGRGRPSPSMLSATELAALLGWPIGGHDDVPGRRGPLLAPAPQSLLTPADPPTLGTRILGESLHPVDSGQQVILPTEAAVHHLHVVSPIGSGKSTLLGSLALADAAGGRGLLVMDPKGDLIADLLARLPEERHDDVVLIEPEDQGLTVGINPLRGERADAERRADELLWLFKETFGRSIGPRSSDLLLHALITAARLPDGTLADVPALLTNPVFRRRTLAKVNDELVLGPFWASFDAWSEAERTGAVAPVLNKLRGFLSHGAVRRMISQPKPPFKLDELFSKRRIVLINLNRGLVGPETAKLLGSIVLSQLSQVIQRRAAVPPSRRHPVMVVIDEWQDFTAGLDFAAILAQARGLHVGFTLAHQHLDQLSPDLRSAVLANARNRIVFRPARADAKPFADVLGARADVLERLGAFQAAARVLVDHVPSRPFVIRTLDLPMARQNAAMMRRFAKERYGVDGKAVDAALLRRWQGGDASPGASIGVLPRSAS